MLPWSIFNRYTRSGFDRYQQAQGVIAPDTALYHDLKRALTELSAAARSIRDMADYLERHPEALIKGKGAR